MSREGGGGQRTMNGSWLECPVSHCLASDTAQLSFVVLILTLSYTATFDKYFNQRRFCSTRSKDLYFGIFYYQIQHNNTLEDLFQIQKCCHCKINSPLDSCIAISFTSQHISLARISLLTHFWNCQYQRCRIQINMLREKKWWILKWLFPVPRTGCPYVCVVCSPYSVTVREATSSKKEDERENSTPALR